MKKQAKHLILAVVLLLAFGQAAQAALQVGASPVEQLLPRQSQHRLPLPLYG
ncbi:MAG: hypothetical protein ABIG94_09635 [Pseudomonadota bacterium]